MRKPCPEAHPSGPFPVLAAAKTPGLRVSKPRGRRRNRSIAQRFRRTTEIADHSGTGSALGGAAGSTGRAFGGGGASDGTAG